MHKKRNTGTGNGMRGTRGMGGNVIFWEMSPNIPGDVLKHSGECRQTFWGMSPNILHALNSQIQLILAYISILFQK